MALISIVISDKYFEKDPQSSDLGQRIIREGVLLLDELGFEKFTFKKLATRIHSTEASIYRYFENKLKLLLYLTTWYWAWVEHTIDYHTHHVKDPQEKLHRIWEIVCHVDVGYESQLPISISALRRIVEVESDKTYLTKEVDQINSQGLFKGFKGLCHKIAETVMQINPDYKHPHSLVSMMLESSHQQAFFAEHLPSLTEVSGENHDEINRKVATFMRDTVSKVLG
jgi:AcrR family transcriptional regulator